MQTQKEQVAKAVLSSPPLAVEGSGPHLTQYSLGPPRVLTPNSILIRSGRFRTVKLSRVTDRQTY